MSEIKLSEIRARTKRACEKGQYHYFPAASHALFHDIPDLLDLVKRLGKALEVLRGHRLDGIECWCFNELTRADHTPPCKEARALLKELGL